MQFQVAQTIVENPTTTKPLDIEYLVIKAFNNKDQKEGDKNELGYSGYPFEQFSRLQELKNTLPKALIKIFYQLVAKH